MNNFDKEKFAELLLLAIGKERSLNQYALNCEVSSAHISRLSRCLLDTPPHPEVLLKMSKASQGRVSYKEFMSAAGYIDEKEDNYEQEINIGLSREEYNALSENGKKQIRDFARFVNEQDKK